MNWSCNHWLIAGIALLGCSGRAQSTCDSNDQCTPPGSHSATGGAAGNGSDDGMSGSRASGAAGKAGSAGKATPVMNDGRTDSQTASRAGNTSSGASNLANSGASTGGASTGGASTGGASTGGASTGGTTSNGGGAPAGGSAGARVGGGGTSNAGASGASASSGDVCDSPYCKFGTDSSDGAAAVAVDSSGNIYVAGNTNGALASPNAGATDVFVRKLDAKGATLWTRQFGSSSDDFASSIVVDSAGNVYVGGDTYGALSGTNAGSCDSFLRKFDASGATLWTRQFGSPGPEQLGALALDTSGQIYAAGSTYPTGNQSSGDPFVRKFDASGSTLWAQQFGGADEDEAEAVAVDASGNVYVAGWTYDLIPDSKLGSWDAFVRKLDASGAAQWTRVFGTANADVIAVAAVDGQGNLYVVGSTSSGLAGPSFGSEDAFIRKFDTNGATLWTRQIGSSDYDYGVGLGIDGTNNVYVVGSTSGAFVGTNAGAQDAYVRKLDASGSTLWTKQFGTASDEAARGATVDASGAVYVVGYQGDSVTGDAFLLRVSAQSP